MSVTSEPLNPQAVKPQTVNSVAGNSAAGKPAAPKGIDDYFPLINKGIMFVILCLAVVFATGVDLTALAGRLTGGADGGEPVAATTASTAAVGDWVQKLSSQSWSITQPGGWKIVVAVVVGLALISGVVFAVLSANGRDANWDKVKATKAREEKEKMRPATTAPAAVKDDDEECNLSSYKLLYGKKEESKTEEASAS